jgi:hypothetical protein
VPGARGRLALRNVFFYFFYIERTFENKCLVLGVDLRCEIFWWRLRRDGGGRRANEGGREGG